MFCSQSALIQSHFKSPISIEPVKSPGPTCELTGTTGVGRFNPGPLDSLSHWLAACSPYVTRAESIILSAAPLTPLKCALTKPRAVSLVKSTLTRRRGGGRVIVVTFRRVPIGKSFVSSTMRRVCGKPVRKVRAALSRMAIWRRKRAEEE